MPNHIAIIQDGNRRYAKMLGIDTAKGHRAGADKTEEMLDWAHELGVKHITLYTFSTENFSRNKDEVEHLFALFKEKFLAVLKDERVKKYKIRVQMVGDRSLLPPMTCGKQWMLLKRRQRTIPVSSQYRPCLRGKKRDRACSPGDPCRQSQTTRSHPVPIDVQMVEAAPAWGKRNSPG